MQAVLSRTVFLALTLFAIGCSNSYTVDSSLQTTAKVNFDRPVVCEANGSKRIFVNFEKPNDKKAPVRMTGGDDAGGLETRDLKVLEVKAQSGKNNVSYRTEATGASAKDYEFLLELRNDALTMSLAYSGTNEWVEMAKFSCKNSR